MIFLIMGLRLEKQLLLIRNTGICSYGLCKKNIFAFLEVTDYDLKLLFVHHTGKFNYLEDPVLQCDKMKVIPIYFKELEEAIENIPAHILAHFDYGFRKFDVTVEELKDFEPQRPARPLSQNDRVQLDF